SAGFLHDNGAVNIRLGDFFGSTSRNFTLNGSSQLDGSGTINLINSLSNAPTGQLFTAAGNNQFFTGTINVDGGHGVLISKGIVGGFGGFVVATASPTAFPVVGSGVDEGQTAFSNNFVIDNTGAIGGVFAYTNATTAMASQLNLATIGNGNWYFGSTLGGTGTYAAGALGVGSGAV